MKTIMIATDFSTRSDRALRRATLLAKLHGASLSLVHVIDDDQPRRIVDSERAEAIRLLDELVATLRSIDGVSCEGRVLLATPFAGIVQAATDLQPDLLVIGSHRRQILRDIFVGTTAERTIRSVACPVLMVNAPPVGPYHHILYTTDLSETSRQALAHIASVGIDKAARCSIVHVFDAPALRLVMRQSMSSQEREQYLEVERKSAADALASFLGAAGASAMTPILRYPQTSAPEEILAAARGVGADLIVLATHAHGGLAKIFLGSVTEEVLRTADLDVLVVPPATRQNGAD